MGESFYITRISIACAGLASIAEGAGRTSVPAYKRLSGVSKPPLSWKERKKGVRAPRKTKAQRRALAELQRFAEPARPTAGTFSKAVAS
jgi:hypothetical protein